MTAKHTGLTNWLLPNCDLITNLPAPPATPAPAAKARWKKPLPWVGVAIVVAVLGVVAWMKLKPSGPGSGFVSGNGRIEATESDIATKLAGRVQFRVAQPGEVLAAGAKVLNLVDLNDVYLTFFLPETAVGKVALGSEVRIIRPVDSLSRRRTQRGRTNRPWASHLREEASLDSTISRSHETLDHATYR
jgi:hypothetical protein